mgnify:CR=1 FL=1
MGRSDSANLFYGQPSSITLAEAQTWLKEMLKGEIGGLEIFFSEEKRKIQQIKQQIQTVSEIPVKHTILSDQLFETFEFYLKKPAFYSIVPDESIQWLSAIDSLKQQAWIQLLFQKDKQQKWNSQLKQQYDDYLQGISYPSRFEPIRKFQLKIASFGERFPLSIPSFEGRKEQTVFRFVLRGYVQGEERERKVFIHHLLHGLNLSNGENQWGVRCKNGKIELIEK